jgi:hypothetical protein
MRPCPGNRKKSDFSPSDGVSIRVSVVQFRHWASFKIKRLVFQKAAFLAVLWSQNGSNKNQGLGMAWSSGFIGVWGRVTAYSAEM